MCGVVRDVILRFIFSIKIDILVANIQVKEAGGQSRLEVKVTEGKAVMQNEHKRLLLECSIFA